MIKSVRKLKRALKRGDYCGVVLYAGPSRIDGARIVAIACRILEASGVPHWLIWRPRRNSSECLATCHAIRKESYRILSPVGQKNRRGPKRSMHGKRG